MLRKKTRAKHAEANFEQRYFENMNVKSLQKMEQDVVV